jgi:predicted nuclease of predicted toxin-antitoxin system
LKPPIIRLTGPSKTLSFSSMLRDTAACKSSTNYVYDFEGKNLSILSAQWAAATLAVDVLDARAAGLAGKTDREVRRFAIETDRILVTLDADFGNLIRFSPSGTPGVIWLRPRPPTEVNIRSILAKWLYRLREIDLHGQLAVVEEDKLRIRGAIEE